jgi:hypothetical protein
MKGKPKIKSFVIYDTDTLIARSVDGSIWIGTNWQKPKRTKWERLGGDRIDTVETPAVDIVTEGHNQAF